LSLLSKIDIPWFLNRGKTSCYTHHTFLLGFPMGWSFTTHKDCCWGMKKNNLLHQLAICLPITFGTQDNYRTESLNFNIAYIVLPYNAILGYLALARFMEAMHHGFNVLKISGANGMIIVRCNEKDALRSVEHVYHEATTMFPTNEDLLEHFGDLVRKKQRAAEKKASLEPHLQGSTGKKFTASASPTPSEDMVHPMLDMSIGEAAVPSGRRPQFTQERSATKKVPLQAGGYKNFVTIGAGLSPK
jgi:hypothetical protein